MPFGFGVGIQRLGSISVNTLSALTAITPGSALRPMGIVTADGTASNNGIYTWNGSAWAKQRGLPDGLGSYTSVSGTNTITATLASGVDPAQIRGAILTPANANTGAVTLNGEAVVDRSGNALGSGALQANVAALLSRDGSQWRLLNSAIATIADVTGLQTALDSKLDDSQLDTDGTLAANSATKIPAQSAVVTYVAAAISAVRNGVSSAFDTLSEIATELALKATIASPTFTGTVGGITNAMVGLGSVDNTSDATKNSAAATLTNKRVTPRIGTTASSATPAPDANAHDQFNITALAAAALFSAPSGTPTEGQKLLLRIKDNGTARALTWNAIYRAMGTALPTTTVISKTLYIGLLYNGADSKWDCVAVALEA